VLHVHSQLVRQSPHKTQETVDAFILIGWPWAAAGPDKVAYNGEIGARRVHKTVERISWVGELADDDIAAPCPLISEVGTLYIGNAFVDGERGAVLRDNGVEDDVGLAEMSAEAIQGLQNIIVPSAYSACCAWLCDRLHMDFGMWHSRAG